MKVKIWRGFAFLSLGIPLLILAFGCNSNPSDKKLQNQLANGSSVKVRVQVQEDGTLYAEAIDVTDPNISGSCRCVPCSDAPNSALTTEPYIGVFQAKVESIAEDNRSFAVSFPYSGGATVEVRMDPEAGEPAAGSDLLRISQLEIGQWVALAGYWDEVNIDVVGFWDKNDSSLFYATEIRPCPDCEAMFTITFPVQVEKISPEKNSFTFWHEMTAKMDPEAGEPADGSGLLKISDLAVGMWVEVTGLWDNKDISLFSAKEIRPCDDCDELLIEERWGAVETVAQDKKSFTVNNGREANGLENISQVVKMDPQAVDPGSDEKLLTISQLTAGMQICIRGRYSWIDDVFYALEIKLCDDSTYIVFPEFKDGMVSAGGSNGSGCVENNEGAGCENPVTSDPSQTNYVNDENTMKNIVVSNDLDCECQTCQEDSSGNVVCACCDISAPEGVTSSVPDNAWADPVTGVTVSCGCFVCENTGDYLETLWAEVETVAEDKQSFTILGGLTVTMDPKAQDPESQNGLLAISELEAGMPVIVIGSKTGSGFSATEIWGLSEDENYAFGGQPLVSRNEYIVEVTVEDLEAGKFSALGGTMEVNFDENTRFTTNKSK